MNTLPPNPENCLYYTEGIGWYNTGGCDGFSSFLHNPNAYLTKEQETEVEKIRDPTKYLVDFLTRHFGDKEENMRNGLTHQNGIMIKEIMEKEMMGIIRWGANLTNIDVEISIYTTIQMKEITLTANSLCTEAIKAIALISKKIDLNIII